MTKIVFGPSHKGDFYSIVKSRVDQFFTSTGKGRHANLKMLIKTALLFSLYTLAYTMIMTSENSLSLLTWYSVIGFTMSLLGFNFSHDVMHGAFFSSQKWNRIWSYFFDLNGTSSLIWKVSHNVCHHTYTNIPGYDEDIDKAILLRLSPKDRVYPFHKYQYLYAPFLYLFTSLNWSFYSDYVWLFRALRGKKVKSSDLFLFFLFKGIYISLFIIIPLMVVPVSWWIVIFGFLLLHFVGGFVSAIIFQLAHITGHVDFPMPEEIKDPWAIHELKTTSNFATHNPIWTFLLGGLNFQIEHHLFTHVCHVHYPTISKIVKQAAIELNIPYIEQPSLTAALRSHFATLKNFGESAEATES